MKRDMSRIDTYELDQFRLAGAVSQAEYDDEMARRNAAAEASRKRSEDLARQTALSHFRELAPPIAEPSPPARAAFARLETTPTAAAPTAREATMKPENTKKTEKTEKHRAKLNMSASASDADVHVAWKMHKSKKRSATAVALGLPAGAGKTDVQAALAYHAQRAGMSVEQVKDLLHVTRAEQLPARKH